MEIIGRPFSAVDADTLTPTMHARALGVLQHCRCLALVLFLVPMRGCLKKTNQANTSYPACMNRTCSAPTLEFREFRPKGWKRCFQRESAILRFSPCFPVLMRFLSSTPRRLETL